MLKFHPVSVLNLNRNNIQKSLITNHQQIGVVLDGDCRKSEDFLIMVFVSYTLFILKKVKFFSVVNKNFST